MGDKDTELLARATANHLFLGQFEPFRATLLTLGSRNPNLARSILQTVVATGGRFDNVLWSHSCPSPSLLTYLSTLELIKFSDSTTPVWSFDSNTLRLRAEFLLYVQVLISRVQESLNKRVRLGSLESKDQESVAEKFDSSGVGEIEMRECLRVLDRVLEVGLERLKPDLVVGVEEVGIIGGSGLELEERELMCLQPVILEHAEVFEALCGNVENQEVRLVGGDDDESGLAITVKVKDSGRKVEEDGVRVLKLIEKCVQIAHLNAMKECLKEMNEDGAVSHVRFLHFDYGVEENDYRYGLVVLCFVYTCFTGQFLIL